MRGSICDSRKTSRKWSNSLIWQKYLIELKLLILILLQGTNEIFICLYFSHIPSINSPLLSAIVEYMQQWCICWVVITQARRCSDSRILNPITSLPFKIALTKQKGRTQLPDQQDFGSTCGCLGSHKMIILKKNSLTTHQGCPLLNFMSEQAGRYIFCTVFHEDLKNVNFFKIRSWPSTPKLGLPCLLNFADQAGWAKLGHRRGLSDQKTEMCFIIRVEKLSF